jgi:hypothetical protein
LAIAFLYLCLILGKTAYADALRPVRAALVDVDDSPSPHWSVVDLAAGEEFGW